MCFHILHLGTFYIVCALLSWWNDAGLSSPGHKSGLDFTSIYQLPMSHVFPLTATDTVQGTVSLYLKWLACLVFVFFFYNEANVWGEISIPIYVIYIRIIIIIFVVVITLRQLCPRAFIRCIPTWVTYRVFRSEPFILSTGIGCSCFSIISTDCSYF